MVRRLSAMNPPLGLGPTHMTDPRATLAPLVGEWSLAMVMPGDEQPDPLPDVNARTTWEWIGGSGLLLQRWSIPFEGAPDGLAVIGWNKERRTSSSTTSTIGPWCGSMS